jgi:hypothetical protein
MIKQKSDWTIRLRSDQCARCGAPFQDGDTFLSLLLFEDEQGYRREDHCLACRAAAEGQTAVSRWQSVFRAPPPPTETVKKETAESLLRKMLASEEPVDERMLYILAVMLERRRLLIERDVQVREDGVKLRVYEYRRTNETFLIPDPELKLDELEPVQEAVVAMLSSGETVPAGPVPSVEAPSDAV